MYGEIFKSIHESVKRRYNADDYMPRMPEEMKKDVIHRGYLRRTQYPIRYDLIPDGKTKNTGKHVYHFNGDKVSGVLEIDHAYSPSTSGHETKSAVNFEVSGMTPENEIEVYRSFLVPAFTHHVDSHNPDIISFKDNIINLDDLTRRTGSKFVQHINGEKMSLKKKVDPKFSRIFSHIRKKLNNKRGK